MYSCVVVETVHSGTSADKTVLKAPPGREGRIAASEPRPINNHIMIGMCRMLDETRIDDGDITVES